MVELVNQKHRIHELDRAEGSTWILILDAGRADVFQEIYEDYEVLADGEYQTMWNNENQNTPNWFKDVFQYAIDGHCFHGGQPIRGIKNIKYDERECFEEVPSVMLYDTWEPPEDADGNYKTPDPASVTSLVEQHLPTHNEVEERLVNLGYKDFHEQDEPSVNMNVVRYLQPHAPYRGLPDFSDHTGEIYAKYTDDEDEFGHEEFRDAYIDNYRWGMKHAAELVEILQDWGADDIIVTADHGECLGDCGQFFHSNDCIDVYQVPWLRVEQ